MCNSKNLKKEIVKNNYKVHGIDWDKSVIANYYDCLNNIIV